MNKDLNYKQIAKYLAGECTKKEIKEINTRMLKDSDFEKFILRLQKVWNGKKKTKSNNWDIEKVWKNLQKEIREQEIETKFIGTSNSQKQEQRLKQSEKFSKLHWMIRAAAIFLVIGFASLFAFYYINQGEDQNSFVLKDVVAEPGQRATVQLKDGSRIRLNSGSSLQYPTELGEKERNVKLSGEAYFEVVHDGRPFLVHVDGAVIEVLGTEFNVQSFNEGEADIEVVVADGKVAVRTENRTDNEVYLEKGDMATIVRDAEIPLIVERNVDLSSRLGWLDYSLIFDDTTMGIASRKIERWYGVKIEFADSEIEDMTVSASFHDESIYEVLRVVSIALNVDYKIESRKITFYSKDDGT